jgi:xanthine dehydrogenase accessory factor
MRPARGNWSVGAPGEGPPGVVDENNARFFLETLHPPADFVVIGAGDDAVPLVRTAADAGFRVTLVDHRSAYLRADLFPSARRMVAARASNGLGDLPAHARTLVVVKNHAIGADKEWARLYAATPVPYIGLLGPKARRDDILASLPDVARPRAYGPIGLDLGAEGAEQIALSIVAEALAVQAGRTGGHLRSRTAPIHG